MNACRSIAELNAKKKKTGKQVQTERGLIFLTSQFKTKEDANNAGFYYAFTAKDYGDLYSRCTDEKGYCREFAVIQK